MRIGLAIPDFRVSGGAAALGPRLAEIAQSVEAAGFDSLWVWDHLFWDEDPIGPGVTDRPMLEAYTTLGFLAGVTRTIRLGALVTGVTYRHPGALIKQVTTLDVLSGGRAYFGIGAAWFEHEHRAIGIPFPPTQERFERLEETLQIAHLMWSDAGDHAAARPFGGKHYQLERTLNVPQSIQRPRPPVLIGGNGEKITLRLVAQYADACNLLNLDFAEIDHKLAVLRGHCERLGRPYDPIEKTLTLGLRNHPCVRQSGAVSPASVLVYCRELAAHGIQHVIFNHEHLNYRDPAELALWAAEIVPALRALPLGA